MSRGKEKRLSLRVDSRNYRICIHRSTLREIGEPAFIHLGVHPDTMSLIVLGTWIDERRAIRVRFSKGGSFFVNSKPLIAGIQSSAHLLEVPGSYLLKGKKIGSIPAIAFSLRDIEIEDEGVGCGENRTENRADI